MHRPSKLYSPRSALPPPDPLRRSNDPPGPPLRAGFPLGKGGARPVTSKTKRFSGHFPRCGRLDALTRVRCGREGPLQDCSKLGSFHLLSHRPPLGRQLQQRSFRIGHPTRFGLFLTLTRFGAILFSFRRHDTQGLNATLSPTFPSKLTEVKPVALQRGALLPFCMGHSRSVHARSNRATLHGR